MLPQQSIPLHLRSSRRVSPSHFARKGLRAAGTAHLVQGDLLLAELLPGHLVLGEVLGNLVRNLVGHLLGWLRGGQGGGAPATSGRQALA